MECQYCGNRIVLDDSMDEDEMVSCSSLLVCADCMDLIEYGAIDINGMLCDDTGMPDEY